MKLRLVLCMVSMFASISLASAGEYRVLHTYKLGGPGGWDYLTFDATKDRLFISRGTHVMVVGSSGTVQGDIPNTPGVHGITLAQDLGRAFISNGRENTVSVVDLDTLKLVKKIDVTGQNPDAILYDPASQRVFTFNGRSQDATAIDAAKMTVVGTIKLDGKPEFAVSDEKGHAYVNIEDKNEVTMFDTQKLTVDKVWPLKGCEAPSGLSIDRQHHRLFSGCSDSKTMAISDYLAGSMVASTPICDGTDGTAYDDSADVAFASCHDGHLSVVRGSGTQYQLAETVDTQMGARTLTVDPKSHRVFTVSAKFGAPPSPTPNDPHPRPSIDPDSFVLIVVGN